MELIERPGLDGLGLIGKRKNEKYEEWNKKFGKGNWGFIWTWEGSLIDFEHACLIYEEAYYLDSFERESLWKDLFKKAKDFYDNAKTNINSKNNYLIQEASSTHIQDIAVRSVGEKRGWKMNGKKLIQIRGPESEGSLLIPGKVKFHKPQNIELPDISSLLAEPNSVEAFYENNMWLYVN